MYTYVANNPIKYIDPTGHCKEGINFSDANGNILIGNQNDIFKNIPWMDWTFDHFKNIGAIEGTGKTQSIKVEMLIYAPLGTGFKDAVKTFYGHSEIAIGDKIYTYGRYDSASVYGPGGIYGDGVLIVADKEELIAQSRKDREIYGFTLDLSNEEALNIEKFYTDLIQKEGTSWKKNENDTKYSKYKFNDGSKYKTYEFVGGDNCSTIMAEALNSSINKKTTIAMKMSISPAMFLRSLEAIYYNDKVNPFYKNGLVTEFTHYPMAE